MYLPMILAPDAVPTSNGTEVMYSTLSELSPPTEGPAVALVPAAASARLAAPRSATILFIRKLLKLVACVCLGIRRGRPRSCRSAPDPPGGGRHQGLTWAWRQGGAL